MIQEAIAGIAEGRTLGVKEAESVMSQMMSGEASPSQVGALLAALRVRGETDEEIQGFVLGMRAKSLRVTPKSFMVADTCGTGGDGKHTLNISTGAALAAAGAGVTVAKHGNRAMSSKSGSADVLAALGVKVDADPATVEKCLNETGLAFCFAQTFHPAMRFVAPIRREIGIRTVFNILGPLANPAGAQYQVLGVARRELAEQVARVLARLGTGRSIVVHSEDGLDELTITAPNIVIEVAGHEVKKCATWQCKAAGLGTADLKELTGGNPEQNASMLLDVLKGKPGAFRDAILYNAGTLCWLTGMAKTVKEGAKLAAESLDSGAALAKLDILKRASHGSEGREGPGAGI